MAVTRQKCVSFCRSTSRLGQGRQAALLSIFAEDAAWCDPVGHAGLRWPEVFPRLGFRPPGQCTPADPKLNRIVACGNEGILDFTMQYAMPHLNQGWTCTSWTASSSTTPQDPGGQCLLGRSCASAPQGWTSSRRISKRPTRSRRRAVRSSVHGADQPRRFPRSRPWPGRSRR